MIGLVYAMQNSWHVVVIDGFADDRGEVELRHDKQLAMIMIAIYRKTVLQIEIETQYNQCIPSETP